MNPSLAPSRPRVLCVDDEPALLEGLRRTLDEHFDVTTASSGIAALERIAADPEYAVVVSDMRMPQMDGSTFLGRVRGMAPATTRILLTGQSDATAAMTAVNYGGIFRFLMKPCLRVELLSAVEAGVVQHTLVRGEHDLLADTLNGSLRVMSELLRLRRPELADTALRAGSIVRHVARVAHLAEGWKFEAAALLHNLGGAWVRDAERDDGTSLEAIAHAVALIRSVPRLGDVAEIVRQQREPLDAIDAGDVELGVALVRMARVTDRELARGRSLDEIAADRSVQESFSRSFFDALPSFVATETSLKISPDGTNAES